MEVGSDAGEQGLFLLPHENSSRVPSTVLMVQGASYAFLREGLRNGTPVPGVPSQSPSTSLAYCPTLPLGQFCPPPGCP